MEDLDKQIDLNRLSAEGKLVFYDKAAQYAFVGEKEIAFEILYFMEKDKKNKGWMLWGFETDPRFESMRKEEAFQLYNRRMEEYFTEIRDKLKTLEKAGLI